MIVRTPSDTAAPRMAASLASAVATPLTATATNATPAVVARLTRGRHPVLSCVRNPVSLIGYPAGPVTLLVSTQIRDGTAERPSRARPSCFSVGRTWFCFSAAGVFINPSSDDFENDAGKASANPYEDLAARYQPGKIEYDKRKNLKPEEPLRGNLDVIWPEILGKCEDDAD